MSTINYRYIVGRVTGTDTLAYLFVSGKEKKYVLKIIQFEFALVFNRKSVYNLGFGDFNTKTDEIADDIMTNNGDVFRVFNTVLSTIELFFDKYPEDILIVQGSDNEEEFEINCRSKCVRNCNDLCYKSNRRMKLYCKYLSKKLEFYKPEYQFFGGTRNKEKWFDFEEFKPNKLYDSILIYQKND